MLPNFGVEPYAVAVADGHDAKVHMGCLLEAAVPRSLLPS